MNVHDDNAMASLAGSFHEAGHAVVAHKLGHEVTRITRHETVTRSPPDATAISRAAVSHAGAIAVAKFDNGQGRHTPDDDGDRANIAKLDLTGADNELARSTAAGLVEQHWQRICDTAFALDRSANGRLDPDHFEELCR